MASSIWTRLHETGTLDDMATCPYNTSHVMLANKLQSHLLKCRKQHPDLAKKFQICQYNQNHHIHEDDMEMHLTICPQYHHFQRHVLGVIQSKRAAAKKAAENPPTETEGEERQAEPTRPPTKAEMDYRSEWE